MSTTKWSVRTRNDKSGTYALYHGRAYPNVAKQAPADNIVRTDYSSAKSIYNDPVFQLNEQDMDDLDGADGAPICYEHNKGDVVGFVKHSYVNGSGSDGDQALDIIARIPVKDADGYPIGRGEEIVQQIMAGKIKGFSVNYTAKVDHNTNMLRSKAFHEISLVREPFFGGCDLNVGVMASADNDGGGNVELQEHFFVPFDFEMSAEASTSTPQQAAPQQQQQQQQQASTPAANVPPSGASAMPSAGANRVAEGLLAQTDILKDDSQRKSEALQRMEQRNAYLEAQMAKQLQSYRAKQLPKLEQYIKEIEETTGTPLGEESKKKYYNLFTSPDNEEEVERMTQVMQRTVNLVASKKAADEELARMKADHATLVETMSKVSQKMGGGVNMRQAYAEAVSGNSASGTDQNQKQVEIAASRTRDDSQRRTNARSMFSPHNPTAKEAEWLAEFGYANTTDVNIAASSDNGVQSLRPLPTSFPKPATHQLLYTKEGEKQFPYSMREYNEDLFGVALQQKDARPDVLNELTYVSINSTDDFTCNAYK